MITVKKNTGFQIVPEGEQILKVTSVQLLPSGRPQEVEIRYSHANGSTLRESFSFSKEKAMDILGQRCNIALGGNVPEGTEISESTLPDIFMGKSFEVMVKHVKKDTKTYANIHYYKSLVEVEDEEDDDEELDDEEDDL